MKFDNMIIMIIFLAVTFVVGLLGGIIYFQLNVLDTELQKIDFDIPFTEANDSVSSFQNILDITIYPILTLRDALPYLVYFMIFGFIISLAMVAYLTTKNPLFFTLHILFTILLTYLAIILSNTYKEMLSNQFINQIMVDFPVYNLVMYYLPQIFFITSIVFAGIAFVNVVKPSTQENPYGLNYGGDY